MAWSTDEARLDQSVRMGERASEMVVDPESPLENLLSVPLTVGVIVIILSGLYLALSAMGIAKNGSDTAWSFLWRGFLVSLAGVGIRALADVHYRIDLESETVWLFRRILLFRFRQRVCSFAEIDCVRVDSVITREKRYNSESYYDKHSYGAVLVKHGGRKVRLLDCSYQDARPLVERLRPVAHSMGVEVFQSPGSRTDGCFSQLTGCGQVGCMAVALIWGLGLFAGLRRTPSVATPSASATVAEAPQAKYVAFLQKLGLRTQADYFAEGLIEIRTSAEIWSLLCTQVPETGKRLNLNGALVQTPQLIKAHVVGLGLSKLLNPKDPSWKGRVHLTIEMDFAAKDMDPKVLAHNLQLGLKRMSQGQSRQGKAIMRLLVFPAAKKAEIRPEQHGFLLTVPAKVPLKVKDLGLRG